MTSSKKVAVLVVITFLLVVLVYSSVAKFDALARQKKPTSDITCNKKLDLNTGKWDGSSYQCCYWSLDSQGHAQNYFCADCSTAADGVSLACNDYHSVFTASGNPTNALPPSNNTSTVPPESIFKMPPGTTNVLPPPSLQEQQPPITCPDGSTPDANGVCPPPEHHKGSNLGQLGGSLLNNNNPSSSTSTGDNNNNNDNTNKPSKHKGGGILTPPPLTTNQGTQ